MKHKNYLNALFAFFGFALIGWLSFMRPDMLLLLGIFTCVSGYFLLFLLLMPAGRITLGDPARKMPLARWVSHWIIGHIFLFIVTAAAATAFLYQGPEFARNMLTWDFAEETIVHYTEWFWGIFPWGVFGLWGLAIGYVAYVKKGSPLLYQIGRGFLPKRLEPMLKTFIESCSMVSTFTLIILSAAAVVLLMGYVIADILGVSHFTNPVLTAIILTSVSPFIAFKGGRKLFRRIQPTLPMLFNIVVAVGLALLGLAIVANKWFVIHYPEMVKVMGCPECGSYFANVPLQTRLGSMYWGWWMIWTPLAGSYLARISEGRSLRAFILAVLAGPLVVGVTYALVGIKPFLVLSSTFALWSRPVLFFVSSLGLWGLMLLMLRGQPNMAFFQSGFMRVDESVERGRLRLADASKHYGISRYAPRFVISTLAVLFLHAMAGWYGIQFQLAALGVMVINAVYIVLDMLILQFFKDKTWSGNLHIPPYKETND